MTEVANFTEVSEQIVGFGDSMETMIVVMVIAGVVLAIIPIVLRTFSSMGRFGEYRKSKYEEEYKEVTGREVYKLAKESSIIDKRKGQNPLFS